MERIETIDDLEALRNQIHTVRLRLKQSPKTGLFWSRDRIRDAYEATAAENERICTALPKEIPINEEIGQFLFNLSLDHLKARHELEEKYKSKPIKFITGYLLSVFTPSPTTIASATASFIEECVKANKYGEERIELFRKVDKTMQEILGSYQLTRTDSGYVLKRGSWFVNEFHGVPDGRTPTPIILETAMKGVGINRDILPQDQRYLVDKYQHNSRENRNIGRWER